MACAATARTTDKAVFWRRGPRAGHLVMALVMVMACGLVRSHGSQDGQPGQEPSPEPIPAVGPGDLAAMSAMVEQVVELVAPAIVRLDTQASPDNGGGDFGGRRSSERSPGASGSLVKGPVTALLVDDRGTLVTALSHFPRALGPVPAVLADGRRVLAHPRGVDYRLRLVVLLLEPSWRKQRDPRLVAPLTLATPGGRAPLPGTFCVALGATYGHPGRPAVSFGIVSASARFGGRALQSDVRIDLGWSGGALVDLQGRLLGIPVQLDRRAGAGSGCAFAIHGALLNRFLDRLRSGEDLLPSFLGISLPIADQPAGRLSAPVVDVIPGSAAATAGLRAGDQVIALDGVPVRGTRSLRSRLGLMPAGTEIVLTILRAGRKQSLHVTLGRRS